MKHFSASSSALLSLCRRPFRDDSEWVHDEMGDAAKRGTAVGQRATKFINGHVREELPLDETGMRLWANLLPWLSANHARSWRAEPALLYSPEEDKAKLVGIDIGREYPRKPGWFGGSIDILDRGPLLTVYDIKCTRDIAKYWPQMHTLGLMAARRYKRREVRVVLLHVTEEGVTPHEAVHQANDLANWRDALIEWFSEVPSAAPNSGSHCSDLYCKHRVHCPVTTEATEQLVPVSALVRHTMSDKIQSPEHAAWMLERIELVESMCGTLKEKLKAYAEPLGGLPMSDGKMWRPTSYTQRRVNVTKVTELARRMGASQAQVDACTTESTVTAWKKAKAL
jgi:hypothetical protein